MPAKKASEEVKAEETVEVEAEKVENATESEETTPEVVEEELPETLEETGKRSSRRRKKEEEATPSETYVPPKPTPTSARAVSKNVRVTPRKARLVCDLVRGKSVDEAIAILHNVNKSATPAVMKTIKSAAANATNNFGMDADSLYVAEIYANDGLRMKRYLPRAKGRASHLVRRCSHITCVVKMR